MNSIAWIFFAALLTIGSGASVYLLSRGRIPGREKRPAAPWIIFAGRLCLLAAAGFSIFVINSAKLFILALVCVAASVVIELVRRRQVAGDSEPTSNSRK